MDVCEYRRTKMSFARTEMDTADESDTDYEEFSTTDDSDFEDKPNDLQNQEKSAHYAVRFQDFRERRKVKEPPNNLYF